MIDCFIGLGANLGDRMTTLAHAVELLARAEGFSLRGLSRAWESDAVGPPQPRYLNAVARIGSLLSARATLKRLLEIEEKLGRVRREKWGPRELDLDLLFYGDALLAGTPEAPHPRLHERAFVLGPLCELAPALVHPRLQKSATDLWNALPAETRAAAQPIGKLRRTLDEISEDDTAAEVEVAASADPA